MAGVKAAVAAYWQRRAEVGTLGTLGTGGTGGTGGTTQALLQGTAQPAGQKTVQVIDSNNIIRLDKRETASPSAAVPLEHVRHAGYAAALAAFKLSRAGATRFRHDQAALGPGDAVTETNRVFDRVTRQTWINPYANEVRH